MRRSYEKGSRGMVIDEARIQTLRGYGLPEYGARAYLALLELGVTEARAVARVGGIPVPKVHATLAVLQERGLVEVLPETPRRYAPVPFERYLDRLQEDLLDQARTIDRDRPRLSQAFRVRGEAALGDRGGLVLLRGRRSVLARMAEIAAEATEDLLYLGTGGDALTARLLRALPAGPRPLRVLLPAQPTGGLWADVGEVRVHESGGAGAAARQVAFLACDEHAVLVAHFVPDDGSLRRGDDVGVLFDRPAVVMALRSLAEARWAQGSPVAQVTATDF